MKGYTRAPNLGLNSNFSQSFQQTQFLEMCCFVRFSVIRFSTLAEKHVKELVMIVFNITSKL